MIITIDVREPFDNGAVTLTFVSQADKESSIDIATAAFPISNIKDGYLRADGLGVRYVENEKS